MPISTLPAPARRRPGRRSTRDAGARTAALPQVPVWLVCRRAEWSRAEEFTPARTPRDRCDRIRVTLHGGVSRLALTAFGPCRSDLLAVAIDLRLLPFAGPETRFRVDLDADGKPAMWIDLPGLSTASAITTELLRPLPDEAGYDEPSLETPGDRERKRSRDSLRRTP